MRELVRLRAENAYIKAENEVIKEIALREEKRLQGTQGEKAAIIKTLRQQGYQLKHLLESYANVQIYLLFLNLLK